MNRRHRHRVPLLVAVAAAAFVVTGCSPAPTGDALFRAGEARYIEYATAMHSVIMAIHPGDWMVDQGSYGVSPIPCRIDGEIAGYQFSWRRALEPAELDVDQTVETAKAAFEDAGLSASTAIFGEGERQKINVIGSSEDGIRGVVTMRPGRDTSIIVSATTDCVHGDAADLSDMVYGGLPSADEFRRSPAFEGTEWQPQFYFPKDGSTYYYTEDGTPILPRPTPTEFPEPPYAVSDEH